MKKILVLVLVLIMSLALLASCGKKNKGNGGDSSVGIKYPDGSITHTSPEDGELIWSGNVAVNVLFEDNDDDFITLPVEIDQLCRHIKSVTGVQPLANDNNESAIYRIVIENFDSAAVDNAYKTLDKYADMYALAEKGESAFMLYAEGNTLVIAYSDQVARYAAIDYICTKVWAPELYGKGALYAQTFNTVQFVAEMREAERAAGIEALEQYIGKEGVTALKNIYRLYDERIYLWLANLYDPCICACKGDVCTNESPVCGTGGFYYSVSGRDNEGFLPDIESTKQALGLLDSSGLTGNYRFNSVYYQGHHYWQNMISDEMKEQVLNFAISLQASDRYFYHPQWGTSIQTSRKNRDAGSARTIITVLGGKPTYGWASDSDAAAASLTIANPVTQSVTTPTSAAVSLIVPPVTAAAAELESVSALRQYIIDGISGGDTYSFFNTFSTRSNELRKAGMFDAAVDILCELQKDNGLWDTEVNYNSVSGLMKICDFVGSKMDPNKAVAGVRNAVEVALREDYDTLTQLTFVYNPWVVIEKVLPRTGTSYDDLLKEIKDQSADLIEETLEKLKIFKRADGGFSMGPTSTSSRSQGAYVAIEDTPESDVNATSIAISTVVTNMMKVLLTGETTEDVNANGEPIDVAVEVPRMYYQYDAVYFLDTINNLGRVEKKPYSGEMPEVETFDNYDSSDGNEQNGVVLSPSANIDINLGTEELGTDGNYKFYHTSIVDDPVGIAGDLVLYMKSLVYDLDGNGKINGDEGKECAVNGDGSNAQFNIINATMRGNCYIFEADMLFEDAFISSGTAMQLMFSDGAGWSPKNSTWVNFTVSVDANGQKYLVLGDNANGADGNKAANLIGSIPAGQWTKIRIEMYKSYDEQTGDLIVRNKFFVNGNYVCESDGSDFDSKTNKYNDYAINCVRLSCFRSGGASVYINNVYAGKEKKDYVPETINDTLHDNKVEFATRYDFNTTTVTNGIYSERYSTQKVVEGENRTTVSQTSVSTSSSAPQNHDYGVFFSLASDPKDASDTVLKVESKGANSAVAGSIKLDTAKEEGKRIHVLTYQYMFVNNSAANQDILQLELLDVNGNKMGSAITLAYNTVKSSSANDATGAFKMKNTTAATKFNNNTWYTFRVVIDSDNKTVQYHYSTDGVDFIEAAPEATIASSATIGMLNILCNTYNNTGTQYLDDINYYITDTAPTARVVVTDMAADTPSTSKVTYDFTSGAVPYAAGSYKFIATSITTSLFTGDTNTFIAGSTEYNTYVADEGKTGDADLIATYGTQYYVTADPTDATNHVLQIITRCAGLNKGGMPTSYLDIQGSKLANNVTVLELTFDLYTDYYGWYASNFPALVALFWDGQYSVDDSASNRSFGLMYNAKESNGTTYASEFEFNASQPEGQETNKQDKAFKVSGKLLSSHTWYTFKVIVHDGKNYVYYKAQGSNDKYELLGSSDFKFDIAKMKYVRFQSGGYNNTSRFYLDNISFVMTDTYVDPTK